MPSAQRLRATGDSKMPSGQRLRATGGRRITIPGYNAWMKSHPQIETHGVDHFGLKIFKNGTIQKWIPTALAPTGFSLVYKVLLSMAILIRRKFAQFCGKQIRNSSPLHVSPASALGRTSRLHG